MHARSALTLAGLLATVALPGAADAAASRMKTMTVPSEAMVPTIPVGGTIDVRMGAYQDDATPRLGDIVVVHPPAAAERGHGYATTAAAGPARCARGRSRASRGCSTSSGSSGCPATA